MKRNRRDAIHWGSIVSGVLCLTLLSVFAHIFASALLSSGTPADAWEKVSCRIVSSDVERRAVDDFAFAAEYAFFWDGRMRHSTVLDPSGDDRHRFRRLEERLPLLEKYAPGTEHVCLVEPGSRGNAVLPVESPFGDGPSGPGWAFAVLFGAFFLLVLLLGVWQIAGAFPRMRRLWNGRPKKAAPAICMALFGLPFALIGGAMLRTALAERALDGGELVAVPGKVLYSGVAAHSGSKSTTYSARVGYEYEFQGKKYEGDRVGGLGGEISSSNHKRWRRMADSCRPGDAVQVWVLPSDPRRSSLRLDGAPTAGAATLAGSLVFLFAGLVISVNGVVLFLRALPRRPGPAIGQPRQLVLRRSHADVVMLALFAIMWNGISFSLASLMLPDLLDDFDPMFLVAAVFPLIGIGLLVALAVALWRNFRAPKLSMILTLPGDAAGKPRLDWRLDDPSAVRSLAIRLEGIARGHKGKETAAVSLPVAKHDAPLPESWSETFAFPPDPGNVEKWRLAATLRLPSSRRPLRLSYPLPDDASP